MQTIQPELIERYQILLQKDPKSKVFAPLAEAYRKLGLKKQALDICENGVKHNPSFAGGRVALARVYLEMEKAELALEQLKKAVDAEPENILALSLLGETQLQLKHAKEALKAFKLLLFLNPNNEKAQKAVQRLESLTADDFEEDVFAMKPLRQAVEESEALAIEPLPPSQDEQHKWRDLERLISLTDAFLVRNDIDRALDALKEAERSHGPKPEIVRRLKLINQRNWEQEPQPAPAPQNIDRKTQGRQDKLEKLQLLLANLRELKTKDK